MAKIICPNCDSLATNVSLTTGRKYYCARCGWNAEIARAELRSSLKIAVGVAAFGAILAIVARVRNPGDWASPVMLLLAFSGLPAFWVVRAWGQLRVLRTILLVASANRGSDVPARTTVLKGKAYPELVHVARPRKLKTTWRGRLYLGFAIIAVSLCTYFGLPEMWKELRATRASSEWVLFLWSAIIYGYSFAFFRNRLRERQLLANGELATGYITKQTNGRYTQSVEYRFQDRTGSTVSGRSTDASRSLYEGMSTPVFYDSADPKHNISLDCSLTKIDAP